MQSITNVILKTTQQTVIHNYLIANLVSLFNFQYMQVSRYQLFAVFSHADFSLFLIALLL